MTDFSYQLYSSRNFEPLGDTFAMLGRLGFTRVEGFGGLFDGDLQALRAALDEAGLRMTTAHMPLDLVDGDPRDVTRIARALDIEAIFVPAIAPQARPTDAEGWAEFGRHLALVGKPLMGEGLTFGWHNHDFEFAPLDSAEQPLDLILAGSDDLALELDLAWVAVAGEDPLALIRKHADRLAAAHLKDIAPKGEAADEDGWADLGHGTMDWPALMGALRDSGCRHFVLEHDNPSDHERFARRSLETARAL